MVVLNFRGNLLRSAAYLPDTTTGFGLWPLPVIDSDNNQGGVYVADVFNEHNTDRTFDTYYSLQSLAREILTGDYEQSMVGGTRQVAFTFRRTLTPPIVVRGNL